MDEIKEVKQTLLDVSKAIQAKETEMKNLKFGTDRWKWLASEKKALMDEKKALMEKEKALMDEKNLLLQLELQKASAGPGTTSMHEQIAEVMRLVNELKVDAETRYQLRTSFVPRRSSLQALFSDPFYMRSISEIFGSNDSKIEGSVCTRIRNVKDEIGTDIAYGNEDGELHNKFIRLMNNVFTDERLPMCHYAMSTQSKPPGSPHWQLSISNETHPRTLVHSFRTPCIDTLRPDFVVYDSTFGLSSASIVTIVEMYLTEQNTEPEHFQKLVDYNERVLASQLRRSFIISAISSINHIRFVKSCRNGATVEHTFTDSLTLQADDHFNLLVQLMLNDELNGYVCNSFTVFQEDTKQEQRMYLDKFLAAGRTARVFSICNSDAVCKVVAEKGQFELELAALRALRNSSDHFVRLVGMSVADQALIFDSRGVEELEPSPTRLIEIIPQQFECLKALKAAGWVHRDVVCRHFLRRTVLATSNHQPISAKTVSFTAESPTKQRTTQQSDSRTPASTRPRRFCTLNKATERSSSERPSARKQESIITPASVFLIDFGFARRIGTQATFAGSANYAPVELLKYCYLPINYKVEPWHDWVTLINCLSLYLHGGTCDVRRHIEKFQPATKEDFDSLRDFWAVYYSRFKCCARFVEMCRQAGNSDLIFDEISAGFQAHIREEMELFGPIVDYLPRLCPTS